MIMRLTTILRMETAILVSLILHAVLLFSHYAPAHYAVDTSPAQRLLKVSLLPPHTTAHLQSVSATQAQETTSQTQSEDDLSPPEVETTAQADTQDSAAVEAADVMPSIIKNHKPNYPEYAKRKGYEGTVVLKVKILKTGDVSDVQVSRSSGHRVLDDAAVAAIQKWKFSPAEKNKQPIDQWVQLPINFSINKG